MVDNCDELFTDFRSDVEEVVGGVEVIVEGAGAAAVADFSRGE